MDEALVSAFFILAFTYMCICKSGIPGYVPEVDVCGMLGTCYKMLDMYMMMFSSANYAGSVCTCM